VNSVRLGIAMAAALAVCACASVERDQASRAPPGAQTLAFPGAEGAGANARGGRGGAVIKVTTLADSGPGSLRAAIDAEGPRTIVFALSGTIALKSPLRIEKPLVTIAGQTAPGDGITLRDQPLIVAADDVVVRFIRSRLGDLSRVEADAITVTKGRRIILDHVSASWSTDETLSLSSRFEPASNGFYDVTVQWSIISESLDRSIHSKGRHGYGTLIRASDGARLSFHHNLWALHQARGPRPGNYKDPDADPVGPQIDFRNNVFYDWGGDPDANHANEAPYNGEGRIDGLASGYNADLKKAIAYNFINNAYVRGRDSGAAVALCEHDQLAHAFFSGNTMDGRLPRDPWSLVTCDPPADYRLMAPLDPGASATDSAAVAYRRVLAEAGASVVRDAVDKRIVRQVRTGSGRIIDSQREIGGWPRLYSRRALRDGDGDGMPDTWERTHHLDPHDGHDGALDPDGDGFTNLEDYLNGLVSARR